jgi:hypothetical protein
MPLVNYIGNRVETLGGDGRFGIQRGTLPNITASVTSSCINYEDTGFISMSGITGGRGPEYNYSLFDVSASAFITQSTAISSALISNLSNSTYSLNISNLGVFAYTQSIVVSCPPPPNLEVEYLVVAGGTGGAAGTGGSAGGVLSGSLSIPYRTTLSINVGSGGLSVDFSNGQSSSISSSTLGFVGIRGGFYGGNSGNNFSNGLSGPEGSGGGGAGSSQDGQSGVEDVSGNGGNGSIWLNGLYYGGGGGGVGNPDLPSVPGLGGLGGGGTAQFPGTTPDDLPYQLNGYNGRGAGAAGASNTKGGDGTVIIRYSTGSVRPAFGGNTFQSGGYYYHEFGTGSGDFRYAKS